MIKLLLTLLIVPTLALAQGLSPEARKQLFQESLERLKESQVGQKAPKLGETFPDLVLENKKLSEWTQKGAVLLTFYRGGWCPYCLKQLKEIQAQLPEIERLKTRVIAISPEQELQLKKTQERNQISFTMISDNDGSIARSLHLLFKVEDAVAQEYEHLGISLKEAHGNDRNELPIPATYLIDRELKVRYAFVDLDYTKRASLEDLLKMMKEISK